MFRLPIHIPSIFKKPPADSDRIEQPHLKATFYGMGMIVLCMVCFIFILWIVMAIVRLFSGFAI